MKKKLFITALVLMTFGLTPLFTQVEPGDAEDETATDVLSDHDETDYAYDLFADDFEHVLEGSEDIAFFVPADDVLADMDVDELSFEDIEQLFNAHVAYGLASQEPLNVVEWFATADQGEVEVDTDDGDVYLDDDIAVEDEIAVENGIVYVIDDSLE